MNSAHASPRVLLLVNGLGLGNSTRCHAIVQRLTERGAEVAIITSGNGKWYFEGRQDAGQIHGIEAFYYASHNGRISIPRTLLSVGDFRRIAKRNAAVVETVLDTFRPQVTVIDSVYTTAPMKRRGIPIAALNNADVVHTSYRRFSERPRSIRMQFYAIEEMDYLFHRARVDLVLSPNLDESLPEVGGNVRRIGPIVRRGYEAKAGAGPVRRVLVMLSGSRFGTPVALKDNRLPFHIDIVGREAPKDFTLPPNIVYHGRVRDNAHIVQSADLLLVNGGFSAVSEAFALRKPMVVLPVPNHAEQWVNGRTIEKLGVGFMAGENDIEQAMLKAIAGIDELRAAYARLPDMRDGAAEAAEHIITLARGRAQPVHSKPERVEP
ncbi:MAG: glycosyltransferase family protein [Hyphomicrobiaceae bacterium]